MNTLVLRKRVKDLEKGDVFVYDWSEWRVTKIKDRIYFRRNREGRGGWGGSFGLNCMMMVEYVGARADFSKSKTNDNDNK